MRDKLLHCSNLTNKLFLYNLKIHGMSFEVLGELDVFFSLIVFGGPEAPFGIYSPLPSLRGQPTKEVPDDSPSKDWQSTVG